MMDYFRKLPGFKRSPSGLEWRILKKLPLVTLLGTILPALLVLILHSTQWLEPLVLDKVIILTIGIVVLHWTFMLTIGIAAFVVMVMKGPAYVADPYYPPDFNEVDDEISFRDI
jgi:hypothetical protein